MENQRNWGRASLLAVSIALGLGGMSCADDKDNRVPVTPAEGGEQGAGAGAGGTAGTAGVTDGGGANPDPDPVRVQVSGSAQKGPLVAGSSVNVFGLDSELESTGTVFPSQTEDSLGSFDVSANLTEELVEVVVQGPFYDELTGNLSEGSIVLRALAAATPATDLRVNLLTTASKNRIRYLVRQGQEFGAAVAQAEDEVLSAFGIEDDSLEAFTAMDITGSTGSDAALIAISAILLQYADDHSNSEGEKVAQLGLAVSTLASDLEEDGVLNDSRLSFGIPTAAVRLDVDAVTTNLEQIYADLGQSIVVPDIEPFIATVGSPAPWQFAPSLPMNLQGYCACAVNDKIYVMGAAFGIPAMFQYDPATKQWEPKAPSLHARHGHACSVLNGLIYITGGSVANAYASYAQSDDVEVYNPVADAWTSKNPMPLERDWHASTTLDGKIYVMGGSPWLDSVLVYDPARDAWEPRAPLPIQVASLASAAVDGKIYVFGGAALQGTASSIVADVYAYDPLADAWTPRAPLSRARSEATAVALGGKIYVIGGYDGTGRPGTVEEYDPPTDTWKTKTAMNIARNGASGGISGDLAYVIGGNVIVDNSGTSVATVETYDPLKDVWSH
jgi:N-acetylneuraminic acid mutarotase